MAFLPKIICSLLVAFATIFAMINFPSTENRDPVKLKSAKGIHYAKDRAPMVFESKTRKSDEIYDRKMKLKLVTEIPLGKSNFKKQFEMTMEAKEKVEDFSSSGQTVENTFVHFTRTQDSTTNGKKSSASCDTAVSRNEAEATCLDLYDMLGQKKYVVNDDGSISMRQHQMAKDSNTADLGTKQLQQIARLLKHIPKEVAVKTGDVWDASTDMGDKGKLSASGTLLGFVDYSGFDCAAIDVKGTLHMESEQVKETMGGAIASAIASQISVPDDATLHTILYYDYSNGLIRWSSTTMKMVMSVMQKTGYSLTMPITEIIESSSTVEGETSIDPLMV